MQEKMTMIQKFKNYKHIGSIVNKRSNQINDWLNK